MKAYYERLSEATVRMEQMVLLAGMLSDGDSLPGVMSELLDEDPDVQKRCFPDMPDEISSLNEADEFKEAFMHWAWSSNKWGFVVQFARPVMRWDKAGTSADFSWGYYNTAWLYGDSIEEVVDRGLAWAKELEDEEKAKAAKADGSRSAAPVV